MTIPTIADVYRTLVALRALERRGVVAVAVHSASILTIYSVVFFGCSKENAFGDFGDSMLRVDKGIAGGTIQLGYCPGSKLSQSVASLAGGASSKAWVIGADSFASPKIKGLFRQSVVL